MNEGPRLYIKRPPGREAWSRDLSAECPGLSWGEGGVPILRAGRVAPELGSESYIKNMIWDREVKTSADKSQRKTKKCTKIFM